ncbi:endonuclease-8 [Granulicella rosea]|uniref:DNA-(apurinic or apyrimidinic site) lyase n=1 Tax=Granulicella rosea TaxID=474952 RepID=A0A239L4F9_9BACT|nr:DNA-formamidopyrimidine glycosylase family protein [Granulicella rosea]SNT24589.1 endonuclease-8 [Granulicella rosea]
MPEGNELHRWAERHNAAFAGGKVRVAGPNGRFTDADALDNRVLNKVTAVGKHLGYDFGKDLILHVHLGLQGDFTEGSGPLPEVKGALRLRMWNAARVKQPVAPGESRKHSWYSDDDGTGATDPKQVAWVELRGPTDCSIYTQAKWDQLLARLGPDPLNGDKPDAALEKIGKSKKPIAALLMEQDVIAGIGNIYRAELLFRARLSPFTLGKDVPVDLVKKIYKDAIGLMKDGMVDRRIVTTLPKDRPHKKGQALKEEAHYVYRRNGKPCWICGTDVMKREGFVGRNLFWCPTCQAG